MDKSSIRDNHNHGSVGEFLQPMAQYMIAPKQKSMRFFMVMLEAFFALVRPVSCRVNPACMTNTSIAPRNSQIVSSENPRL